MNHSVYQDVQYVTIKCIEYTNMYLGEPLFSSVSKRTKTGAQTNNLISYICVLLEHRWSDTSNMPTAGNNHYL